MCISWKIKCVILAKHWLWLPDDGFLVNRNILEKVFLILKCFNNSTFFNVVCIIWEIKCVILAKHWLWLPDDGFLLNRNMLEQLSYFKMF